MIFRELKADEIDCRVSTVAPTGVTLLLYKDARVDQNILDETVGTLNWQRSHQLIGDRLYCTVSVWDDDKKQWISKQDVGTESYTEKEKGQASDSFKRACFNLGIGRELYTAPFIWISSKDCEIKEKNGKKTCYDKFEVSKISYKDGKITALEIVNTKINRVVYKMGKPVKADDFSLELASDRDKKMFMDLCKKLGVKWQDIRTQAGYDPKGKMTVEEHGKCLIILKEIEEEKND